MVQHVVLCQVYATVPDDQVEWIIRQTRIRLLKIGEVRGIRCGKRIDPMNEWRFFYSIDYESMDKMSDAHGDPVYKKFVDEVIYPYVGRQLALNYESEPGKDVRYS